MIFELSDHLLQVVFLYAAGRVLMSLKIAVHLHLYYENMWDDICRYLSNLQGYDYDLFVTLVVANASLSAKIKQFKPQADIRVVENRGYDVGAFINFLHQIDLSDYDYILKLHTKNKQQGLDTLINHRYLSREQWFKLLWNAVLGSKKQVGRNLRALRHPNIGMIGSRYLITSTLKNHPKVEKGVYDVMQNLGFSRPTNITFIPGTMFWVKAETLKIIKDNFVISDFEPTDGTVKDGTLAHVLERVLGCAVVAQGWQIRGYDYWQDFEKRFSFKPFLRFCYQKKYTRHHKMLIKVLKLPIYNRKIA